MAQTANALLVFEPEFLANSFPIKASTEIFLGAAVGLTAGYARQLTVPSDVFAGFAEMHVNNSVATDGADRIPVKASGRVVLTVAGVDITSTDAPVYASDSQTFTLTSTGNVAIGKVFRWISTGVALVAFDTTNP